MRAHQLAILCATLVGSACTNSPGNTGSGGAGGTSSVGSSSSSSNSSSSSGSTLTDEDALRQRLTDAMSPLLVPPFGTAAAVTAAHGDLQVNVTLGTLWDGGPVADDKTRFNVASVSKVLTAARIASLAHEGKLGLDDPLGMYLPGVKLIAVGGGDPPVTITIRHLLMHRSGLPKQPPDLAAKVGNDWTSPDLLQKITASWGIQLVGNPGDYLYSNLGYALLGAIIEIEGGCSFADCMAGYLSELAMSQSTFWPATLTGDAAHGRVESQGVVTFHAPSWYGSRYAIPFSGLWTTMPELAGFGRALIAASKDTTSPLYEMTQGDGYGLGIVHSERLGAPSLEHDGSTPGFYAALVAIPDLDIVVSIATNGGNDSTDEIATFTDTVDAIVSAVPNP